MGGAAGVGGRYGGRNSELALRQIAISYRLNLSDPAQSAANKKSPFKFNF